MKNIPIPDALLESSGALRSLWLALLLRADGNGELSVTVKALENELEYPTRKVRTMLDRLTNDKLIVKQTTNKTSNITICGFDGLFKSTKTKRQTNDKQNVKQTTNKKAIAPGYVSPPFVTEEYREIWQRFIEYRKEIKKPYKSESSERTAYNKMVEMSGNDPDVAKDMIERSILGQWQGLYNNNNGKQNGNNQAKRQPPGGGPVGTNGIDGVAAAILQRTAMRKG